MLPGHQRLPVPLQDHLNLGNVCLLNQETGLGASRSAGAIAQHHGHPCFQAVVSNFLRVRQAAFQQLDQVRFCEKICSFLRCHGT